MRTAMIEVQCLDPILLQRQGMTMHITGEYAEAVRRARLGEKRGKWKILSGIEGMEYQNKEMIAGTSGAYLTKQAFTLTHKDVFGKKGGV